MEEKAVVTIIEDSGRERNYIVTSEAELARLLAPLAPCTRIEEELDPEELRSKTIMVCGVERLYTVVYDGYILWEDAELPLDDWVNMVADCEITVEGYNEGRCREAGGPGGA